MKTFIVKNSLYLMTALGVVVVTLTAVYWSELDMLQRLVSLLFAGLILHLWEEGKLPGGFTQMITDKLNFTAKSPHFGVGITVLYVLIIVSFPFIFPHIPILAFAALYLGILEVFAHLMAIKMYDKSNIYSPGLITSVVILLPVSIYAIVYAVQNDLMQSLDWLYSFLILLGGLGMAQQIVVRGSGMKYSDFLKNVKTALFTKKK